MAHSSRGIAGKPLQVLVVDDEEKDALHIVAELRRGGYVPDFERVETGIGFLEALSRRPWDLVIADHSLLQFSALGVLDILHDREVDVPVIVVSGSGAEQELVAVMRAGAHDCLRKNDLGRLSAVVHRELCDAAARRGRREGEHDRREAEERYRALIEEIPALTYVAWADELGTRAYVSPQLKAMAGFEPSEWLAEPRSWADHLHPEDREQVLAAYRDGWLNSKPFTCEYRILDREDRVRWWRDEGRPLQGADGSPQFVRGFVLDISERRQAEETVRYLTSHDLLTGLPNRVLLLERLEQTIGQGRGEKGSVSLLFLTLDRFREINNTLGHKNGDRVIKDLARRLADVLGGSDHVARVRGDEFGILLPGADAHLARQVASKVLQSLEQGFVVDKLPIEVSGSIGISVAPEHGEDAETLLRRADLAVQAAKRDGSGCVVYSAECDPYDPRRLVLLGELRRAIERDELLLHYQPKVDLKTQAVVGAEALVRWRHPKQGLVPPDRFIPLAEQGGLIKPLTHWVLNQAVSQCGAWQRERQPLPVAVNLSARSLLDPQLVDQIGGLLQGNGIAAQLLQIELTESAVMADPARSAEILRSLEGRGVGLSIDDFGTGYSSLAYLRRLPVRELKIDKSFVIGMCADVEEDATIVRSTNDLGHNLGLRVVAEGVEDQKTLDRLASFGCDAAQGYHIARPMGAADLTGWMKSSPWRPTAGH